MVLVRILAIINAIIVLFTSLKYLCGFHSKPLSEVLQARDTTSFRTHAKYFALNVNFLVFPRSLQDFDAGHIVHSQYFYYTSVHSHFESFRSPFQ